MQETVAGRGDDETLSAGDEERWKTNDYMRDNVCEGEKQKE